MGRPDGVLSWRQYYRERTGQRPGLRVAEKVFRETNPTVLVRKRSKEKREPDGQEFGVQELCSLNSDWV